MSDYISPDELRRQQAAEHASLVIDVRSAEEYAAGHLPGAVHLPADQVRERLAELPRDRPVVPYCTMRHPGESRSERVAALLRARGYEAQALNGGFPTWEAAGLPVEQEER